MGRKRTTFIDPDIQAMPISPQLKWQRQHIRNGQCTKCSRPVIPGRKMCAVHNSQWAPKRPYRKHGLSKFKNAYRRLFLYGIKPEEYDGLLTKQGGVCAICKNGSRKLAVDHCHKSNRVRGLLCRQCNIALGMVDENPEIVSGLMSYLTINVK